jgi:hypothetical protein
MFSITYEPPSRVTTCVFYHMRKTWGVGYRGIVARVPPNPGFVPAEIPRVPGNAGYINQTHVEVAAWKLFRSNHFQPSRQNAAWKSFSLIALQKHGEG